MLHRCLNYGTCRFYSDSILIVSDKLAVITAFQLSPMQDVSGMSAGPESFSNGPNPAMHSSFRQDLICIRHNHSEIINLILGYSADCYF